MNAMNLVFGLLALSGASLAHPFHPAAVYSGYAPAFGYAANSFGPARTALDSTPYFVNHQVPYLGLYPAGSTFAPLAPAQSLAVRAPVIAATAPVGTLPFLPVTSATVGLKETIETSAAVAEASKPSEPDALIIDENTNPDENADAAEPTTFALRRLVPLFTNSLRTDAILFATPEEAKAELPEDAGQGVVVADFGARAYSVPAGIAQAAQPTFF